MRRLLCLVGLALLASAGAQDLRKCGGVAGAPTWVRSGVYSGTLGPKVVTLALDRQDIDANRYFYAGRAGDLSLTAFHSGETLILQEEVRKSLSPASVVTGCFTLTRVDGGLRGSWKAPGAASPLKVSLEPLNVAQLPLKLPSSPGLLKLRRSDPLSFVKLNRAWVMAADGQSVREPLSGLTYPRVPGAGAALRATLQDRLLLNAVDALQCLSLLPEDMSDEGYTLNATVTLLTSRLLSLREDVYYFCGGAHPGNFSVGLILDRMTGQPVPLAALWPSLTPSRLKTLYLAASAADPVSECDDVLRDMAGSYAVSLGSAGLTLTPDGLPHVYSACAESVTVPYGQLRRGANTASPYFADLYPK